MAWAKTGNLKGPPSTGIERTAGQVDGYVLSLADVGKCVPYSNPVTAGAFIISKAADVAFKLGDVLYAEQMNFGSIGFNPPQAGGLTIFGLTGYKTRVPGEWIRAINVGTDSWEISRFIAATYDTPDVAGTDVYSSGSALYLETVLNRRFTYLMDRNLSDLIVMVDNDIKTSGIAMTIAIRFKQPPSGGPYTFTPPAAYIPVAGSDTTLQTAANAMTLFVATTFDGARWEYVMRACG